MRARTTRTKKKRDLKQVAFIRFMLIVAILVIWMGGIGARLVYLQVNQHEWLKDRAGSQRRDRSLQKLPRGTIYDRENRALAISVRVKTLYADATRIEDVGATAKKLAAILDMPEKALRTQLTEAKSLERKFVPLKKGLDEEEVQKVNSKLETAGVRKADLPRYPGLHWREDQKRSYPGGSLASHVIGFSNAEGVGQAGIEQSQNDILYGAIIKRVQERDRLGRVYDESVSEKEPPKNVVLTLDSSVQFKTEQALESAVKASRARSGTAIVISNKTGEVLAMANYPSYNPNRLDGITANNLTNSAVQSMYSPGSVFKLVTYGAALERKLITPESEIDSGNGTIEVAKRRFKDSKALGRVTYAKAMAVSSNVCAIKTSMRVGKEGFHSAILDFGFGTRTGIELPAETPGVVRSPERWYGDSMASMSIGYEIGVSALQMATAFATIANDGVRIQPHLIKEIRQSDETPVFVTRPERTRVVSVETSRGLRKMLKQVVINGTGKLAQPRGYTAAGKTGTAWKFDEATKRISSAKYISSFIGFAPADDPEVTIAVVIDEPKVGGRGGGAVAAPVFKEIADGILPDLKVKEDGGFQIEADRDTDEEIPETVGNGEELIAQADNESEPENSLENVERREIRRTPARPEANRETADRGLHRSRIATVEKQPGPRDGAEQRGQRNEAGTVRKRIETENRN